MKKLLLLTKNKDLYSIKQLEKEAKNGFDSVDVKNYKDLNIHYKGSEFSFSIGDDRLEKYTHIISRTSDDYYFLRYLIARQAENLGIRMLNREMILSMPYYNKLSQLEMLGSKGFPLPETEFRAGDNNFVITEKILKKKVNSRLARHVDEIEKDEMVPSREYLYQKILASENDFRVMLIGGKVVGGVKRVSKLQKTDSSESEKYSPTSEEIELTKKVGEELKSEYLGIDIMYDEGKPYILEVNIDAGFKTFDKLNDSNVAKLIIDQILS